MQSLKCVCAISFSRMRAHAHARVYTRETPEAYFFEKDFQHDRQRKTELTTHKQISRLILLVILAVLSMAPAMAQTGTVYAGQTTPITVEDFPGDSYTWELYNEVAGINFVVTPGKCRACIKTQTAGARALF